MGQPEQFQTPPRVAIQSVCKVGLVVYVDQGEPKFVGRSLQVLSSAWREFLRSCRNCQASLAPPIEVCPEAVAEVSNHILGRCADERIGCPLAVGDGSVHATVAAPTNWDKPRVDGAQEVRGAPLEVLWVECPLQAHHDLLVKGVVNHTCIFAEPVCACKHSRGINTYCRRAGVASRPSRGSTALLLPRDESLSKPRGGLASCRRCRSRRARRTRASTESRLPSSRACYR